MLRDLSTLEIEYVSGGNGDEPPPEDEIIVSGNRTYESLSDQMFSFGGMDQDLYNQHLAQIQLAPLIYDIAKIVIGAIITLIGVEMMEDEEKRESAERDIGTTFGNTTVTETFKTSEGKTVYKGADGWIYADSDNNGQLDSRYRPNYESGVLTSFSVDNGNGTRVVNPYLRGI